MMLQVLNFRSTRILGAFVLFLAAATAVRAQDIENPRIGIVDVQRVLRDAKAAKSVRPEMEKLRKEFQTQVKNQEQALRTAEQELAQQRAILSREAFADKRRAFSEQASEAQRAVQAQRRELDKAFNATKNIILENLIQVAQNIAKAKNLNIVMEKRFVFISARALDITDDVLAGLDKRLPVITITVDRPKPNEGGAKGQR
jgi:outer membrane protein